MPRQLVLLVMLAYMGISGCSFLPTSDEIQSINHIPLSAPTPPARRIVQNISAQWQDRQDNLLCILELDEHHIAVAGLTQEGMSLFNLSYDGSTVNMIKSPLLPDKLRPDLILKDIQLAYWPLPMLQKKLPKAWRITTATINNQSHRQLFFNEQLFSDITYRQANTNPDADWPKSVELINHRYHYKLLINTVSYEVIP